VALEADLRIAASVKPVEQFLQSRLRLGWSSRPEARDAIGLRRREVGLLPSQPCSTSIDAPFGRLAVLRRAPVCSPPRGLADGAVVACAERTGGRVMTFDRGDFDVVASEISITLLP
jgi:hypothetical protein